MPLTPFRRRKLEKMFSVFDHDGDGAIARADFLRRVDDLARYCGWAEDSPQYQRHRNRAIEEWDSLRESADTDEDGRITRADFLRYGESFLADRDAVRAYARGDVQLIFDAMDTDADGRITVSDYRTYLEVCGVDASAADLFFGHADLDEDGHITRSEMAHAMEEFLLSEKPDAASNLLFGPLEAR